MLSLSIDSIPLLDDVFSPLIHTNHPEDGLLRYSMQPKQLHARVIFRSIQSANDSTLKIIFITIITVLEKKILLQASSAGTNSFVEPLHDACSCRRRLSASYVPAPSYYVIHLVPLAVY